MRYSIFVFLVIQSLVVQAQYQKTVPMQVTPVKSTSEQGIKVNPEFEFSSLTVSAPMGSSFEGSYITAAADTFWLKPDEHGTNDKKLFSRLIIFTSNQQEIYFYNHALDGAITFHFLNAHTSTVTPVEKPEKKNAACLEEPESISQEIWRAGLAEPNYDRIVHQVKNQIIHHSAGSNTDTAYTDIIRNIYVYHTEARGWSDIGYNYVVAQNGDLYKGRDPGMYEQDNVMGAHFCASNTTTMGICMLGDYEKASPTKASLETLAQLLAWKASKEEINALSIFNHPLNSSLDHISGHRDGCATLCPGENLYNELDNVRHCVDSIQQACGYNFEVVVKVPDFQFTENNLRIDYHTKVIEITALDRENVHLSLVDIMGNVTIPKTRGIQLEYSGLAPGIYLLMIHSATSTQTKKVLLH